MKTVNELAGHIVQLAAAFRVVVIFDPGADIRRSGAGTLADDKSRHFITMPPVTDHKSYAIALHELGHCISPLGCMRYEQGSKQQRETGMPADFRDMRLMWDEELDAWAWARHYALEWTPAMSDAEDHGLRSYQNGAAKFGLTLKR